MKLLRVCIVALLGMLLFTACQQDDLFMPGQDDMLELRAPLLDVINLPDGFKPEGIVVGKNNMAYVGSIYSGAIWKFSIKTGEGDYLVGPTPGIPTVGLTYDKRTGYLFAAKGFGGAVLVYDSSSGEQVGAFQLTIPSPTNPTWVNDLIVTNKAVYITDSFRPFLYKIPLDPGGGLPDPGEIEEIPLGGDFQMSYVPGVFGVPINANGIDATPNGKTLVIAHTDYGLLYKVDPKTGDAIEIDMGDDDVMNADGILLEPGHNGFRLYVVQGFEHKLTTVDLSSDLESGVIADEDNDPNFQFPTTVSEKGNSLYVVNARFDISPPSQPTPDLEFTVVRVDK